MRLILIAITFPMLCWSYSHKDIKLSDYEFKRYVRPQLISIKNDYHTLLSILNPELKNIKKSFSHYQALIESVNKIKQYLKQDNIASVKKELKTTLEEINDLLKFTIKSPELLEKKFFSAENLLSSQNRFFELRSELIDFKLLVENIIAFQSADISPPISLYEIPLIANKLYIKFNLYLINSTDNRFQKDFTSFWTEFIKPVTTEVIPYHNQRLFIARLNQFNIRLNMLHMILTKRNKVITKQTKTLLTIIQNRWNSILKVTLRR